MKLTEDLVIDLYEDCLFRESDRPNRVFYQALGRWWDYERLELHRDIILDLLSQLSRGIVVDDAPTRYYDGFYRALIYSRGGRTWTARLEVAEKLLMMGVAIDEAYALTDETGRETHYRYAIKSRNLPRYQDETH